MGAEGPNESQRARRDGWRRRRGMKPRNRGAGCFIASKPRAVMRAENAPEIEATSCPSCREWRCAAHESVRTPADEHGSRSRALLAVAAPRTLRTGRTSGHGPIGSVSPPTYRGSRLVGVVRRARRFGVRNFTRLR